MARDYYRDGFDTGYGRERRDYEDERPQSDGDSYSYRRGFEDGERRREIANELDREYYGDE